MTEISYLIDSLILSANDVWTSDFSASSLTLNSSMTSRWMWYPPLCFTIWSISTSMLSFFQKFPFDCKRFPVLQCLFLKQKKLFFFNVTFIDSHYTKHPRSLTVHANRKVLTTIHYTALLYNKSLLTSMHWMCICSVRTCGTEQLWSSLTFFLISLLMCILSDLVLKGSHTYT